MNILKITTFVNRRFLNIYYFWFKIVEYNIFYIYNIQKCITKSKQ